MTTLTPPPHDDRSSVPPRPGRVGPPPRDPARERRIVTISAAGVSVGLVLLLVVLVAIANTPGPSSTSGAAGPTSGTASATPSAPAPSSSAPTPLVIPTAVGQRTTFSVGRRATQALALSADGRTLLVGTIGEATYDTPSGPSGVAVVDVATGLVRTTVQTSSGLLGLAVSADGTTAWAAASNEDVVDVIDLVRGTVTARVPTGDSPQAVALSPDGRTVYVCHYSDATLVALDASSGTVRSRVSVGTDATALAVTPDGRSVVVARNGGVSIVDTTTFAISDVSLDDSDSPTAVTVSPDGRRAYVGVSDIRDTAIQVVDLSRARLERTVAVPDVVFDLVAGPGAVYGTTSAIGGDGTGTLLSFDRGLTTMTSQQDIGYDPSGLVLSRNGALVYAVDGADNVSVVRVR